MTYSDYLLVLKRKKQTIISIFIIFFAIITIFTLIQPLKYGASSRLLVVQAFPIGTDPYAVSKSNEHVSNILAKVIATNAFYNEVMTSGYNIDKTYFNKSQNQKKEMKKWLKTVQAKALGDSGIIEIRSYHPDRSQLAQIAQAVNFTLKSKHKLFHGAGDNVSIKVIDKPILSDWPIKPNVIVNFFLAVFFGVVISFLYAYFFPAEKFDIRLWFRHKKKEEADNGGMATESSVVAGERNKISNEHKINFVDKDNSNFFGL